jgi:hypothetical protein
LAADAARDEVAAHGRLHCVSELVALRHDEARHQLQQLRGRAPLSQRHRQSPQGLGLGRGARRDHVLQHLGTGEEGRRREGKRREEKRREEKRREEKRREEKRREGKRREEKGREGKRREEKRREGRRS